MDGDIGKEAGNSASSASSSGLPGFVIVSTTTLAPKASARRPTTSWVAFEAQDKTVIIAAPAPNTMSASSCPPSTVLVSAKTSVSEQSSRAVVIVPTPNRFSNGVPISTIRQCLAFGTGMPGAPACRTRSATTRGSLHFCHRPCGCCLFQGPDISVNHHAPRHETAEQTAAYIWRHVRLSREPTAE